MKKYSLIKKVMALALTLVMVIGLLPSFTLPVNAVPADAVVVTDSGTADAWEDIMGTAGDGSRYAGRVWVDKSVYKDGDTAVLNQQGNQDSSFVVDVDEANNEYFQVIFSALGSSMSTNTTVTANRPLDVVLVLDTSTSMDDEDRNGVTRMERMIVAANKLLADLTGLNDIRIAIVTFNRDSETVIDLAHYNNGIVLEADDYYYNSNPGRGESYGGVITAKDNDGRVLGNDSGYTSGTNLQDGIDRGMNILANAEDSEGRAPIAIVLADGRANRAVKDNWYTINSANSETDGDRGIMLSTLLNAAYGRTRVEKHYETDMTVYGIGIDLSSTSNDYIFLNPGAEGSSGFNGSNTDGEVRAAWNAFETWREGNTATIKIGNGKNATTWTFDHNWPSDAGVTTFEIAANINYVDDFQDVFAANLEDAFDSIYKELATGAFNPISSTNNGATGVENTPLIYVDNIGQYMEIKNIQAVQVFGTTYNVTKNNDGTYSVEAGTGTNPTTNEAWSTASDIQINVLENADGTQQLRVYINQEILPILLDKITVTTENEVTTRTLETTEYPPLRVYYTVGIDSDILLPNGQVNTAKLDSDYAYVDEATGAVSFYSNAFGEMNIADQDNDGLVDLGDAHVGFVPSHNNRFYYHQTHQEIFISATNADGSAIEWDDDMYGVRWEEGKYELEALSYADYASISDSARVYTYVSFHRPTGSGNAAEEVTYLVYTTWGDLKDAATFYDKVNDAFLNGGSAIDVDQVDGVVSAYKRGKDITNDDLIAVLGEQSRRVSRLHNMFEYKAQNETDSAELAYAPAYNKGAHEDSDAHEHSEVIVWLGNNGKLTLPAGTGLKVTKDVTELADGASADEKFQILVDLDMAYTADNVAALAVTDADGDALASSEYSVSNNGGKIRVTLNLADGENAVVLGLPAGTDYTVTEADSDDYSYTYTGASETVAGTIVSGVVTNEPVKAGNLFITKEVVHAHAGEAFSTDYEFEFEVTFVDADGEPIANTTFQLENNYDSSITELTTDEDGVMEGKLMHGETVHIFGIPAGATVTVEEINIPDNYTSTTYRSRNASGQTADNDGVVTIVSDANATVVVTNTYTPDEVGVDISFDGIKNFDATEMTVDSEFTFKLQKYVDGEWIDVDNEVVTIASGANAYERFKFDPLQLEFAEPGVHSYQIVEVKGENADITYDRSVYAFSVNVTIDSNGDLQVEVVGHNEIENIFDVSGNNADGYTVTTVFINQYHTTATSVEIVKSVEDKGNTGKTAAGFIIETYEASVDDEGVWTLGEFIRSTVTDARGEATLVRNYDNTDFELNDTDNDNVVTYHFIIKEKNAGVAGWSYDSTEYRVTVVLTKDDTGEITADFGVVKVDAQGTETDLGVSGDTAKITFANTFDPTDAQLSLGALVKKELAGRNLVAGEFTFAIFKDGEAEFDTNGNLTNIEKAKATGTNDADGNVTFDPEKLPFEEVGKYEYDVIEIKGNKGGVAYDATIYDLVVEVSDNGDGTLKATYYFEDSVDTTVTFENTYTAQPTEVVIDGIKTLKVNSGSKTLKAGDYTFYLYDEQGNKIGEATNLANGTFKFNAIKYTTEDVGKTFTYTVKEVAPDDTTDGSYSAGGVKWSGQSFTVTVKVVDNGDGTLKTEVTGNGIEYIKFVNEYTSNLADVVLQGKKNLENRDLTAGEFKFALYQTNRNFQNPVLIDDTITHDADGEFTVNINDLDVGYYYYVLEEVIPEERAPGIHYYGGQYNITIHVTDSGNGQMTYTKTVVNPGAESAASDIIFNNLYRPDPKQVVLSGTKSFEFGTLADDVFSVELYDAEGNLLDTAFVKADGSFAFEPLTYTAEDIGESLTYTVKEVIPEGATDNGDGTFTFDGVLYDATVYTVVISVADDDKDGELEIIKTVTKGGEAAELTFTNTQIPADVLANIYIQKNVENKTQPGIGLDGFEFILEQESGTTHSVTSNAEGKTGFQITFGYRDVGKTYNFKVYEKRGNTPGVTYDNAVYTVIIKVEQNPDGSIKTIINDQVTNGIELEFTNIYEKPETPVTGDDFPLYALGALLVISGAALMVLMLTKKKKGGKYAA